ncbi:NAD(P)H-dependent oxidoreductase [Roseobacteraceae bacterium S113]
MSERNILVVMAHPLRESLCGHLADFVVTQLEQMGHKVELRDLYAQDYDPRLSSDARAHYYSRAFEDAEALAARDTIVLVFPTWWFGLPAILKGWIDRSFLPGVAYDHASDLSALTPRLTTLRHVICITTLGAPGWIDWLVVRRPVARALKWGVMKACAPHARFDMCTLYKAENVAPARLARFERRVAARLNKRLRTTS